MVSICGSNTKGRPLREHGRIGSNSVRLALRFPIAIRIQCVRSETVVRDGFVNMTAESPSTVAATNVDTTLDRRLWGIAIAFIAGGVMSILDTTIVNVAIKSLSVEFAADVATMMTNAATTIRFVHGIARPPELVRFAEPTDRNHRVVVGR